MNEHIGTPCTAFAGAKCIGSGDLRQVALKVKAAMDADPTAALLIFDDLTSQLLELDLRGTSDDILKRLMPMATPGEASPSSIDAPGKAPRGPGRPKLGVVAREITLLPRHWDWLGSQPGGASVTLRKLVEAAKRASVDKDLVRQSQEASYRFMSAMAGSWTGFEEASRALFAGEAMRLHTLTEPWPADVRNHLAKLAAPALKGETGPAL